MRGGRPAASAEFGGHTKWPPRGGSAARWRSSLGTGHVRTIPLGVSSRKYQSVGSHATRQGVAPVARPAPWSGVDSLAESLRLVAERQRSLSVFDIDVGQEDATIRSAGRT